MYSRYTYPFAAMLTDLKNNGSYFNAILMYPEEATIQPWTKNLEVYGRRTRSSKSIKNIVYRQNVADKNHLN